ncbi:MAG: hypothetical protein AB7T10_04180 [bacterium]
MNSKFVFIALLFFIFSCSFVNDDNTYIKDKINIFGLISPDKRENFVIIDSIASISSSDSESIHTVTDALVLMNGIECPYTASQTNIYNGYYLITENPREGDVCSLFIVYRGDTLNASTRVPSSPVLIGIEDSQTIFYDSSSIFFWKSSNTSFYRVEFMAYSDTFYTNYFMIYSIDDTFMTGGMFRYFLPETITVDIIVSALDTNYAIKEFYGESTIKDGYGIFGSFSKSITKGVRLITNLY